MCDLLSLKTTDPVLMTVILDGIMNILLVANEEREVGNVAVAIEECDGLDKIEDLQRHENSQGIMNILLVANEEGEVEKVALAIEECNGLDKIEDLQRHENNQVHKKQLK